MRISRTDVLLLLLTVAVVAAVGWLPPLAQPRAYHLFADTRAWSGVPHLFNVLSNAGFVLVAWLGLRTLPRAAVAAGDGVAQCVPYAVLFLALAATGVGSAYYHLAPDNARLFWDRLPMSIAFAALVAVLSAERWGGRIGVWLLLPLLAAGLGSVWWWRLSIASGTENVLPYFVFQGWTVLVVLLLSWSSARHLHRRYVLAAVLLYVLALAAEWLDRIIYSWGQWLSGHTLKHLLAALAAYQLVRLLRRCGDSAAQR